MSGLVVAATQLLAKLRGLRLDLVLEPSQEA
jgi:hypothetical protein